MSCDKANNCKKYKMNIGNPNDWENPCNRCHYNISDYDIGYNKAIDDFVNFANTMPTVEADDGTIRPMWLEEMAEQLKAGGKNDNQR